MPSLGSLVTTRRMPLRINGLTPSLAKASRRIRTYPNMCVGALIRIKDLARNPSTALQYLCVLS
jgi:hypothetical protein